MAITNNAATDKVPSFGIAGTFTVASTAQKWAVTSLTVSPAAESVVVRDSDGMTVSRTFPNQDGDGFGMEDKLNMTFIPLGTNAAGAITSGAMLKGGTVLAISGCNVGGSNDDWVIESFATSGSNTENLSCTITASRKP